MTKAYERLIQAGEMKNIITSSCAAINDLVERYYPDMIPYMAPVVSPMIAHGMMLKEEYGPDVRVVYIGNCTAKARESVRDRCRGTFVDAVMDFQELRRWLKEEHIHLKACETYPREGKIRKLTVFTVSAAVFYLRSMQIRALENTNSSMWTALIP